MCLRSGAVTVTRRYNEGSITWDKTAGRYVARVELERDPDGRRRWKKATGRTPTEARRKLKDLLKDRDDGTLTPGKDPTTGEWLKFWTEAVLPKTVTERTREQYAQVVRDYISPRVGTIPLRRLEPEDVIAMMRFHEERGCEDAAVKARKILRRGLEIAMRWRKVARNVAALTDAPKDYGAKLDDSLDETEVEWVLEAARMVEEDRQWGQPRRPRKTPAPEAPMVPDQLEAMAYLVLTMGMRQGEALELRWSDLDDKRGLLTVAGTKGPEASSYRVIPVPEFVLEVLRRHRAAQRVVRMAATFWEEPDLMFATSVGTVIHRRNLLRWWHDLTDRRAGVGRRRFHASRHTAATVMLNNGVALEVVSAILGHAGLAITADVYAKVRQPLKRQAADVMNNLFGKEAR